MIDILTGTAFDAPKRTHRREDEVALEFPSSVSSRVRHLNALKAINWRAIGGEDVKTVKVTIANAATNMYAWALEIERLAAEAGVKNGIAWYSGPDTTRYNLPVACALLNGLVMGNWNTALNHAFSGWRYRGGVVNVPLTPNYDAEANVGDEYTIAVVDCPWFA